MPPPGNRTLDSPPPRTAEPNRRRAEVPKTDDPTKRTSVERSDRKLSPRGGNPQSRRVQHEQRIERWPCHRLPFGPTRPIFGERTEPQISPGKPPGYTPEQHRPWRRSTRESSRSNIRRRQIVRGNRRGSRSSTHAPDEQGRFKSLLGPFETWTEHSSYAEKKRETGTAGTPWKGPIQKLENPTPNDPLPIPRDPPDRDHPCALRHQSPAKTRRGRRLSRPHSIAEVSGPRPKMSSRRFPRPLGGDFLRLRKRKMGEGGGSGAESRGRLGRKRRLVSPRTENRCDSSDRTGR